MRCTRKCRWQRRQHHTPPIYKCPSDQRHTRILLASVCDQPVLSAHTCELPWSGTPLCAKRRQRGLYIRRDRARQRRKALRRLHRGAVPRCRSLCASESLGQAFVARALRVRIPPGRIAAGFLPVVQIAVKLCIFDLHGCRLAGWCTPDVLAYWLQMPYRHHSVDLAQCGPGQHLSGILFAPWCQA
jgi:hypothetical protein